jgi:pimeloyl-ACP methyl ester carboxylesterase
MSAFVLIHGGWHGGWCWRRVATLLRHCGHEVFAPTLTGMGERQHLWTPDVGLATHTQDVLNLIQFEQLSQIILVGHSYGGTVMTLVADQSAAQIDALVYVDAIIPENGLPDWDGFTEQRKADMLAGARTLGGHRVPPPDPSVWGVTAAEDLAWLRACCSPHPLKTMHDAPELGQAWKSVPSKHYILAGGQPNPRFLAHYHAAESQSDWTTEVIDGGHDLMVTHPNELSTALDRIARSTQSH